MTRPNRRVVLWVAALAVICASRAGAQTPPRVLDLGRGVYQAMGVSGGTDVASGVSVRIPQSNTFLVVTPAGNVVIDTSLAAGAAALVAGRM